MEVKIENTKETAVIAWATKVEQIDEDHINLQVGDNHWPGLVKPNQEYIYLKGIIGKKLFWMKVYF